MRLMRMVMESTSNQPEQQAGEPTETKEASEAKGPTIVMKGPLAEIYRKALDVALAKKDSTTAEATVGQEEGIATESQANDAIMAAHAARQLQDEDEDEDGDQPLPAPAVMTVYGVSSQDITDEVVVDVTAQLAKRSQDREFLLYIDATEPSVNSPVVSAPQERMRVLESALESMVLASGGYAYRDFQKLCDHVHSRRLADQ